MNNNKVLSEVQRFYMPYMTQETLDKLKASGTVTRFNENDSYSMYEYQGPLTLELNDRHYYAK